FSFSYGPSPFRKLLFPLLWDHYSSAAKTSVIKSQTWIIKKNTLAPDLSDAKVLLFFQKFLDTLIFSSGKFLRADLALRQLREDLAQCLLLEDRIPFYLVIGHQLGLILINRDIIPLRRDKTLRILRK